MGTAPGAKSTTAQLCGAVSATKRRVSALSLPAAPCFGQQRTRAECGAAKSCMARSGAFLSCPCPQCCNAPHHCAHTRCLCSIHIHKWSWTPLAAISPHTEAVHCIAAHPAVSPRRHLLTGTTRVGFSSAAVRPLVTSSRRDAVLPAGRSVSWRPSVLSVRPPAWPRPAPCCRCGPTRDPRPRLLPLLALLGGARGSRPGPPAALSSPVPPQVLFRAVTFGLNALTLRYLSRELLGVVSVR